MNQPMTYQELASVIANRIPELAKDSPTNNAVLLEGLMKEVFEPIQRELRFVLGSPSLKVAAEVARARQSEIERLKDRIEWLEKQMVLNAVFTPL